MLGKKRFLTSTIFRKYHSPKYRSGKKSSNNRSRGIFWLKIFLETRNIFEEYFGSLYIIELRSVHDDAYLPSTGKYPLLLLLAVDMVSPAVRNIHTSDCVLCCTHTRIESHKCCPKSLDANVCGRTAVLAGTASCRCKVFRVLQRAINTSKKAGPNVSVTPIDPSETSRVFTDDLE